MPPARRVAILRILREESYLTSAQLQSRVRDLLGRGCFGVDAEVAITGDVDAVRRTFLGAGHELVRCDEPGRTGCWVKGRPRLDPRIEQGIRGAIAELDLEDGKA